MDYSMQCELGLMQQNDGIMPTDHQCDFMDYIDEELAAILGQDFPGSQSPAGSDSSSSSPLITAPGPPQICPEPTPEQRKPSDFSKVNGVGNLDRRPVILNFGNPGLPGNSLQAAPPRRNPDIEVTEEVDRSKGSKASKRVRRSENAGRRPRPPSQTYDHIMAERKRREQLSQYFIALSAIVPGLKKMDKTTVLGDTIKYLKHLQERVKTLEEKVEKQAMESVVLVKKSQVEEDEGSSGGKSLPEIEARVCHTNILLKIYCRKHKGVFVKIIAEVEKLDMSVVNTSITRFGEFSLDITIVAEMNNEINPAAIDIVKSLRSAIQNAGN